MDTLKSSVVIHLTALINQAAIRILGCYLIVHDLALFLDVSSQLFKPLCLSGRPSLRPGRLATILLISKEAPFFSYLPMRYQKSKK